MSMDIFTYLKWCNHCKDHAGPDHAKKCEFARLQEAIKQYGVHKSNCRSWWMKTGPESFSREPCSCGLDKILNELSRE